MTQQGTRLKVVFEKPITTNEKRVVEGAAIEIHNAGEQPFTIGRGRTVVVGESVSYGTREDENVVFCEFIIQFDPADTNPRCEITTMQLSESGYGNYIYDR